MQVSPTSVTPVQNHCLWWSQATKISQVSIFSPDLSLKQLLTLSLQFVHLGLLLGLLSQTCFIEVLLISVYDILTISVALAKSHLSQTPHRILQEILVVLLSKYSHNSIQFNSISTLLSLFLGLSHHHFFLKLLP